MNSGLVVDSPSALEFQRAIRDRIGDSQLRAIAGELCLKSAALGELLSEGSFELNRAALRQMLGWVFATRRRSDELLDVLGPGLLAEAVARLLWSGAELSERIDDFDAALSALAGVPELSRCRFDLPFELLHFTSPERYWLWTRWIFEPEAGTGALTLLTTGESDLGAATTRGALYLNIGRAMALVEETGKAVGFSAVGPGPFGIDVLLAAVYGLYMHTILRLRMTPEFNRVTPALPDVVRRLLGVYHLEV